MKGQNFIEYIHLYKNAKIIVIYSKDEAYVDEIGSISEDGGVFTKHGFEGGMSEFYLNECHAIPLTEECLIKCPDYKDNVINIDKDTFILFNDGPYIQLCFFGMKNVIQHPIRHLKALHQLQNLYFALKGQELEIKQK